VLLASRDDLFFFFFFSKMSTVFSGFTLPVQANVGTLPYVIGFKYFVFMS
jgi:hypothetical protein